MFAYVLSMFLYVYYITAAVAVPAIDAGLTLDLN